MIGWGLQASQGNLANSMRASPVFGEGLPSRFFECMPDLQRADLLIVMGTSLQVQPFASLIDRVPSTCPRVLINLERVGEIASYGSSSRGLDRLLGGMRGMMNETGFDFEGWTLSKGLGKEHIRDVFYEGKCDDGILELAKALGWEEELLEKHRKLMAQMDTDSGKAGEAGEVPSAAPSQAAHEMADRVAKGVAEDAKGQTERDGAEDVADQLARLNVAEQGTAGGAKGGGGSPSL